MRPTTIAMTAVLLALTACSSDDSASGYRDAARMAVRNAVLTLDDLPDAWAVSSIGEESYTNIQLTGDCARLNGRGAGFPGEVATANSEPFSGPLGQELVSTVTGFADPDAAAAAVSAADTLVLNCTSQINEALKQAIGIAAEDRNVGGLIGDINTSVEPDATFPAFGDQSLAYRLSADFSAFFQRFDVNGHIIAVRDGPLAAVLVYAALGDQSADEEQAIAARLTEKLTQAAASLPD